MKREKKKLKSVECILMACFLFFTAGFTVFTGAMNMAQREDIKERNLKKMMR